MFSQYGSRRSFVTAFFASVLLSSAAFPEAAKIDRLDILRRANRSTVRIEAVQHVGRTTDCISGAGVVISTGYVLTAHHVVRDHATIQVLTACGTRLPANVAWIERELDLALLAVPEKLDLEAASIAPAQSVREGKAAVVIGNPLGRGQKLVTGRLGPQRLVHWDGKSAQLRAIVANVVPGNSGGGVYDLETGELLGITVAKSQTQANTGYVVPADRITGLLANEPSLRELSDATRIRAAFGATLRPVQLCQGRFADGLLVTHIEPGGLAEAAGWNQGDVLVGLDKYRTTSLDDVVYVLRQSADASAPVSCLLAGAGGNRQLRLKLDGLTSPSTTLSLARIAR